MVRSYGHTLLAPNSVSDTPSHASCYLCLLPYSHCCPPNTLPISSLNSYHCWSPERQPLPLGQHTLGGEELCSSAHREREAVFFVQYAK